MVCAKVEAVQSAGNGNWICTLSYAGQDGPTGAVVTTPCDNIHEGDLVAFHTKAGTICTLSDLHAQQEEFPHCISSGIFVLQEQDIAPGDDIRPIIGADDHVVEFEITPNRPDCLSVIGLAREAAGNLQHLR